MYILYSIIALLLFVYLLLIGSAVTKVLKLPAHSGATYVVMGVLTTSVLQWLVAMPMQFFHASWSWYYVTMLTQMIMMILISLIIHYRTPRKIKIVNYMKNHWFVWIMTIISSFISWIDTIPYNLYNYYDDGFYLSRIGTQINVDKLANYDNYTGLFSEMTLDRVLTTYEIKYSFWLALGHLELIPFVRISCVLLSYLIMYHVLTWCIIQLSLVQRYWVQFVLSSLLIYLVSAAYLGYIGFFRSWDNWQFISAAYFGGNFVRIVALPLFIAFAYHYRQQSLSISKNILLYLMLCVTLMSYSSMSISYIIIGSIVIYLVNYHCLKQLKLAKVALLSIIIIFIVNFLLGLSRLLNHLYYFNDVYIEYVKTFVRVYSVILFILLIIGYYYLPRGLKNKYRVMVSILTCTILGCITFVFVPLMLSISSGYMFVAARIGTSIQILLVLLVMMIWMYHALRYRKIIYLIIYQLILFVILFVLTYFTMPMSQCSQQRYGCQIPDIDMMQHQQPQTHNAITQLHHFIENNQINGKFIIPNVMPSDSYDIQLAVQLRSVKGVQPKILNLYDKSHVAEEIIDNLEAFILGENNALSQEANDLFQQANYILIHHQQLPLLSLQGVRYQEQLIVTFNRQDYVLIKIY